MDSLVSLQHCRLPVVHFSIAPASFRSRLHIAAVPASSKPSLSIRSSFASPPSSSSDSFRQNPQILVPISSSILKTTSVTFAAVAALLLMRVSGKPAIAAPVNPTPTEESEEEWTDGEEEKERELERQLANNPNDVRVLGVLLSKRFYNSQLLKALIDVNHLIELEPNELKWLVWRGFVHNEIGYSELARNDFERVLEKDPCWFRAYKGILYSIKASDIDALEAFQKRVERLLENYKEEIEDWDVKRFKMLITDAKFTKGSHTEAINELKELVREDPMDFAPHFLLEDFYSALGMTDEAQKQQEICQKLLSNNPNASSSSSYLGVEDK